MLMVLACGDILEVVMEVWHGDQCFMEEGY